MTGFLSWTRGSSFLKGAGSRLPEDLGVRAARRQPAGLASRLTGGLCLPKSRVVVATDMSVQSFCERAKGPGAGK